MTQQQQIDLLRSIAPDITRTKDPKGVMLKAGKAHRLSPAQLEKLGHVYNTTKTLIGLEKSANRGDSFTLLDVPDLVASYTTYDPSAAVPARSQKLHDKIDKIASKEEEDAASLRRWMREFDNIDKAASAHSVPGLHTLLQNEDAGVHYQDVSAGYVDENGNRIHEIKLNGSGSFDVTFGKQASSGVSYPSWEDNEQVSRLSGKDLELYADGYEKAARERYSQVMHDVVEDVLDTCEKARQHFIGKAASWGEAVSDAYAAYGDRADYAIRMMENHFRSNNLPVKPIEFSKQAYVRSLAYDRHGIYPFVEKIASLEEVYHEAYNALEDMGHPEKKASALANIGELINGMQSPFHQGIIALSGHDGENINRLRDTAENEAKYEAALQQLLLSDPIIAEADQDQVRDIYETVRKLSPTIANSPVTLGPVLKEGLQYGSLPIQQINDLLKAEETRQKALMAKARIHSDED